MDQLKEFFAAKLPEICSVGVVIIFAYMTWRAWKNRP